MRERGLRRVSLPAALGLALLAATSPVCSQAVPEVEHPPDPAPWPLGRDTVVFAFGPGLDSPLACAGPGTEPIFDYRFVRHGYSRPHRGGAFCLDQGSMVAPRQGDALLGFFQGKNVLALEALFTLARPPAKATSIVAFTAVDGGDNFALAQRGDNVLFKLGQDPDESARVRIEAKLPQVPLEGALHLVVAHAQDGIVLYLNGEEKARTPAATPEFRWNMGQLVLGCGSPAEPGWTGVLEGLAIHARTFSAADAQASYVACTQARARPAPVERLRLLAKLVARSRALTPEEIAPYRESLAVYEYEVVRVLEGFFLRKTIRVGHWVVLGGQQLPYAGVPLGASVELEVEPWSDHPQLENVSISDTLELDAEADLFFDAGGLAVTWKR